MAIYMQIKIWRDELGKPRLSGPSFQFPLTTLGLERFRNKSRVLLDAESAPPNPEPKIRKLRPPRPEHTRDAEMASQGIIPPMHHNFYTAPTHRAFAKRMKVIEDLARRGKLTALKKARAEPFWNKPSSSRQIARRWMDNAITALEVRHAR